MAAYGAKCHQVGLDPEDVLQDVYEALLKYDKSNPWDPARGALSTYIRKVCRSKYSHALDKKIRRAAHEGLSLE
jgi:DNA-directed RNA polymerase specialized sigma24 family protein